MTQINPTNLPADAHRTLTDPAATVEEKNAVANRLYIVNLYLGGLLYFLGMVLIIVTWMIAGGPFYYAIAGALACAVGTFFAAPGASILFPKKGS